MKQHSPGFLKLVADAKKKIHEISPTQLKHNLDQHQSMMLIDVRETEEWLTGHIPTAIHLSRGIIEREIEKQVPDLESALVLYCSGGFRCALVAESLQKMGYSNVSSLETGSQGWLDAGYDLEK